jgi:hypothetical protein
MVLRVNRLQVHQELHLAVFMSQFASLTRAPRRLRRRRCDVGSGMSGGCALSVGGYQTLVHVYQELHLAVFVSQCALFVAQFAIRSPTGKAAEPPPCDGSPKRRRAFGALQDGFGVVAATAAWA